MKIPATLVNLPCITLWQPWAQFIALGWKQIETREHARLQSLVEKRIGIHAGLKWDNLWRQRAARYLTPEQRALVDKLPEFHRHGELVCTAYVWAAGWLTVDHSHASLIACHRGDRHGLFLSNIIPIPAGEVRVSGGQGIWKLKEAA